MDEKKEPIEQPQEEPVIEEKPHYVPRPRWQLVLAWILLILMVIGVAGYYYWIAHRY
ncbi:MAG: hypothetical protein SOY32_04710 [Candidatus Faecousia sp.]|nr:hypothetical protein [Clostridiales bacterium]MDY4219704.1 hypothetical protein [Candidatus Faecousia sp.]